MAGKLVGFVVVTHNSRALVGACLDSLYRQSAGSVSVVVVDNASVDGTLEYLRTEHPGVSLIETGRNAGFAAACNLGIGRLFQDPDCRYVGLVNDDAWLAVDWLERVLSLAARHADGAGFQGLTVDGRDPGVVDSFGLYIGRAGRAIQMGYRSRLAPQVPGEVFGVNAAAALYSRAFLAAQPFGDEYLDADLFMYLEDVDLAARATVMGWRSYYVAGAIAYHLGSGGERENRALPLRMTSRNDVLVLVKNLPWAVVARAIPGMVHAEAARLRDLGMAREWGKIAALLRGRLASVPQLPRFLSKRKVLAPQRCVSRQRLARLMAGALLPVEEPPDV